MNTKIDARGLSCPEPVLLVYKAIEAGTLPIEVTVDNSTAKENIRRMATGKKFDVSIKPVGQDYVLMISKKQ